MYPIKSLASKANVSEQSIRNLLKNNTELVELAKANTSKNGRFIKYGEPVLEWILNYYNIEPSTENEVGEGIVEPQTAEIPQQTAPEASGSVSAEMELDFLKRENDLLRGQIEALTKDKAEQRNEIDRLLLLLQEEKQEKKAMLLAAAPQDAAEPAHQQGFLSWVKSLFVKK